MSAYSPFINPSSNCTVRNLKQYNNKALSVSSSVIQGQRVQLTASLSVNSTAAELN